MFHTIRSCLRYRTTDLQTKRAITTSSSARVSQKSDVMISARETTFERTQGPGLRVRMPFGTTILRRAVVIFGGTQQLADAHPPHFEDFVDLTKASDVPLWLSPDPISSSTNPTEPISWQCCTLPRAPRLTQTQTRPPPKTRRQQRTPRRQRSTPRVHRGVRWADEKKIVSVYSRGSSSPTRVQCADAKKSMSVRSLHEHEA